AEIAGAQGSFGERGGVEPLRPAGRLDRRDRALRNDAGRGLRPRQRRFDVEHALHARPIGEDRPHGVAREQRAVKAEGRSRLGHGRMRPARVDFPQPPRQPRALVSTPEEERGSVAGEGDSAMAMVMNGEIQLAAPRELVWAKLNDTEALKASIPGCETLEKVSDTEFQAVATNKVGPVKARFKGKVRLSDLDPPNGYRISGEGDGGVAGFAKGGATVALSDKDGGTLLTYNVEAQIGGKLAQLGQRLVNGAAKKLADQFFAKFAAQFAPPTGTRSTSAAQ